MSMSNKINAFRYEKQKLQKWNNLNRWDFYLILITNIS